MASAVKRVVANPEIARARRILVESYRRLSDYTIPVCVIKEISAELDGLEAWISSERPHYV